MQALESILSRFKFNIGGMTFQPTLLQAGAILFLLFLLLLMLANVRRHFLDWSIKGALFGLFSGFALALILEGFLLVGGRTAVTEILGWKNAPKPILNALDLGKEKLVNVLGVTSGVPAISAQETVNDPDSIMSAYSSLAPEESEVVRAAICE